MKPAEPLTDMEADRKRVHWEAEALSFYGQGKKKGG